MILVILSILGLGLTVDSNEDPFAEELRAFAIETKLRLGLLQFYLYSYGETIKLDTLIVPKETRTQGIGTAAMNALIQFADEHRKIIALTPASKYDNIGTTSMTRLKKFYKRFGFIENKGRRTNYSYYSNVMIRYPANQD